MVNGVSTAVAGQLLTVTSTATSTFTTALNAVTINSGVVAVSVSGGDCYFTDDNTTPSATSGHVLVSGSAYTWSPATAIAAKFVATTTTNSRVYLSEYMI